jgi:hypothetical protein
VPEYLGELEAPKYGEKRWDYIHRCRADTFDLWVWGKHPTDNGYFYSSDRKTWAKVHNDF